jgi:phage I-like protein
MHTFTHPTDGWYQIEAKGEHPNPRAGIVQVIDSPACAAIAERFNREATAPGFAGMLIDHEHFKHDQSKETVAYGWLTQLQERNDGLYGQIRWTTTGKAAVDGGDYRFFSTEYDPADLKILNRGESPQRVRPMRLDGLTLTNANNNKGQKPITNRSSATPPAAEDQHHKKMKNVCTLLGLSADASEEVLETEVTKILNRLKELEEAQLESDLALYQNRFDPKQREFIKSLLVTNRGATIEFLKTQSETRGQLAPGRLHNRQTAQPIDAGVGGENAAALSAERNSAIEQYKIANRCSFQQANDAVRRKKPELFGLTNRS